MANWFYILAGAALIVAAIISKSQFINDIEMSSTKEERANAKPTLMGRLIMVVAGLASVIYGVVQVLR